MHTLANAQLSIELLSPEADQDRLGPRFCWGGYIWQITDRRAGPLLTGPEWPKADPLPFNGQGLPESFRHRTRDGQPLTWHGQQGVALGGGELGQDAAGETVVARPCEWRITDQADRVEYHTTHAAAGFAYEIVRRIELRHRTVWSVSQLTNRSTEPLKLQWFAHPFFALTDRLIEMEVPVGASLAENPGFQIDGRRFTQKRRFAHEKDGHMDFLRLRPGQTLNARLNHPKLAALDFATSFVPSEVVVWGNSVTFSIEPYQTLSIAPGQTQSWNLRYDFGEPRA